MDIIGKNRWKINTRQPQLLLGMQWWKPLVFSQLLLIFQTSGTRCVQQQLRSPRLLFLLCLKCRHLQDELTGFSAVISGKVKHWWSCECHAPWCLRSSTVPLPHLWSSPQEKKNYFWWSAGHEKSRSQTGDDETGAVFGAVMSIQKVIFNVTFWIETFLKRSASRQSLHRYKANM